MKKISVITINYNNLGGLKKTVVSVFNQGLTDFEYIVIDGGSSDGSPEFLRDLDSQIDIWISEPDNGIYEAMNKGIRRSNGEYLIFLNSGDVFSDNNVLGSCIKYLKGEGIIYGNYRVADGVSCIEVKTPEYLRLVDVTIRPLCHQAMFIRKEVFDKIGYYDDSVKFSADFQHYCLAIFKYGVDYQHINMTVADYDAYGYSSSGEHKKEIEEERLSFFESNFKSTVDYNLILELKSHRKFKSAVMNSRALKLLSSFGFLKNLFSTVEK